MCVLNKIYLFIYNILCTVLLSHTRSLPFLYRSLLVHMLPHIYATLLSHLCSLTSSILSLPYISAPSCPQYCPPVIQNDPLYLILCMASSHKHFLPHVSFQIYVPSHHLYHSPLTNSPHVPLQSLQCPHLTQICSYTSTKPALLSHMLNHIQDLILSI